MADDDTTLRGRSRGPVGPRSRRWRFGWVLEAAVLLAGYAVFERLRSAVMGSTGVALRNGKAVLAIERAVGLDVERGLQQALLRWRWIPIAGNLYYGTVHFVVPVVVLALLYRRSPERYVLWRNALVVLQVLALLTFLVLPLMPPRLLPPRYGYVDTAAAYFNVGPQVRVVFTSSGVPTPASVRAFGNLYAAMPSLHVGWATWCALAVRPLLPRRWAIAALVYPALTLFAVMITANHWFLDGAGGWVLLAAGWAVARAIRRRGGPVAVENLACCRSTGPSST